MDPGNSNYISTIAKGNFLPYGKNFQEGKPTGRFSDGKIPSDFAAEIFGIKELLPAYLDPNLQLQDLLTRVSFASGGTGYDPLTAQIVSVLSFSNQLRLFKEYKEKLKSAMGEEKTTEFLSEALFMVCAGSNDITVTYFITPFRKVIFNIDSYTDFMTMLALQFFKELYELGARRIAVSGVPSIGCIPSQRTLKGDKTRNCAEDINHAASLFNSKLSNQVDSLKKSLTGLKAAYFDAYNPSLSMIQNPQKYGFEEVNKGCCGAGEIEVGILCNPLSKTCNDSSKFIFWDSFHPTEAAYKILSSKILTRHLDELL
ncbi:hypothetical protein SLA2020_134780 [Shorea laevis]